MKRAVLALLVVLIPLQAAALEVDELLGVIAMPLAVAAVAEATDVSPAELSNLVATLNQADLPPTQIVQVVRYVPVMEPELVPLVHQQYETGVRGTQLVTVIEQRIDVEPRFVAFREPLPRDDDDLFAWLALPLAVSAASRATGVPVDDLTSLVASLRTQNTSPVQIVEIVRDPEVRTHVATHRAHPHGGPPGQLKKIAGVQTGAEVVHGERRGNSRNRDRVRVVDTDDDRARPKQRERVTRRVNDNAADDNRGRGHGRVKQHDNDDHGGGHGKNKDKGNSGHGKNNGNGGGHGNGGGGKGKKG